MYINWSLLFAKQFALLNFSFNEKISRKKVDNQPLSKIKSNGSLLKHVAFLVISLFFGLGSGGVLGQSSITNTNLDLSEKDRITIEQQKDKERLYAENVKQKAEALEKQKQQNRLSSLNTLKWQKGGVFEGYTPEQEEVSLRTQNSKKFRNTDGSITAQIGGNYHYKNATGNWQNIDFTIVNSNNNGFAYENTSNTFKSYFPAEVGEKGVSFKRDNDEFTFWKNPELFVLDANKNKLYQENRVGHILSTSENIIHYQSYHGVIDEMKIIDNGIENNIILNEFNTNWNINNAEKLSFKQFVKLPSNTKILNADGILETNNFSSHLFVIEFPSGEKVFFNPLISFDKNSNKQEANVYFGVEESKIPSDLKAKKSSFYKGNYRIKFVEGGILVYADVDASWLKQAQYPVVIDPTVTITPPLSIGNYYGPMTHWYGFQRHASIYYQTEIGVYGTITAIEYNATNTSASTNKPTQIWMRSTAATTVTTGVAWNSVTYTGAGAQDCMNQNTDQGSTIGWKMLTLTTPFNYSADNLMIMVKDNFGGSGSSKYYNCAAIANRSVYIRQDGSEPAASANVNALGYLSEIRITYTTNSPCSGIPSAGTPTVSSLSICPNIIFNLSVTGNSINANGLSGIWQSSPQGLNIWTDVTGSQNQPDYIVVAGVTASTDYRYVVNCSFSSQTAYSSIITVIIDCTSNSPGCPDVNINPGSLAINDNSLVIPCGDNTADLTAEYLKTGGTQSYRVESIPYNPPFPFTGGSGSTSITDDDEWSEIINLGFDFCFYGNTFNKALFSSNGAISFSIDDGVLGGAYAPGSWAEWEFGSTIPSNSSADEAPYLNAIMGVLQDTYPNASPNYPDWSINYQIMGTAPCRMLVVNMYNLALYDCETSVGPQTYQIVIYETTNAIDVYVKDRTSCTTFNSGSGLIGLQNADGSLGIAPPGRNTGTWSAHNEAWRFIPDGTPNYTFGWYDASNVLISTADQLTVGPGTYTSRIVYHTCYGVDITKEQTLIVTKETEIDLNTIVDLEECEETAGTAYFDLTQNSSNALGTNSSSDYTISYYNTQANAIAGGVAGKIITPTNYQNTANPQSVWLRIQKNANTNCYDVADFKLIVKPAPIPTFVSVVPSTNICYGMNVTYTTQSGMTNYTWTMPGTAGSNYTLISGGTSTSNTAVIAWNSDVNGTLVKVGYTENGCAAITPTSSIQVTLPTKGTVLGDNLDNATCVVNQNSYVHFYHSTGRLLASVNSNGQNLGNVTVTSYVEPSHLNVPACLDPTNPAYITATMKRHWVITPQFPPATSVSVRLPFDNTEFTSLQTIANGNANTNDNLVTIANVNLSKYKGPLNVNNLYTDNCTNAGGSGGTQLFVQAANGSVTAYQAGFSVTAKYTDFTIPNFSEFWLHGSSGSPLPVTLTSFSVNCENNTTVNWTTASEQNSDRFIIEKSRDGQNWILVGEQAAAGNSNTEINYSVVDENNWNGITYYRMTQIDINGQAKTYGPIGSECVSRNFSMNVYPNPTQADFTVEISSSEKITDGKILLIDVTGKIIIDQLTNIEEGMNQIYFNHVDLQMGSYLVKFTGGNSSIKPIKLVVQ